MDMRKIPREKEKNCNAIFIFLFSTYFLPIFYYQYIIIDFLPFFGFSVSQVDELKAAILVSYIFIMK